MKAGCLQYQVYLFPINAIIHTDIKRNDDLRGLICQKQDRTIHEAAPNLYRRFRRLVP